MSQIQSQFSAVTLVTGGVRSGKSALAERLTIRHPGIPFYIATAQAGDSEMAKRILKHQTLRDDRWTTVEAPLDLCEALRLTDRRGPRLIDCLTLWLSNLGQCDVSGHVEKLTMTLRQQHSPVVLVTNELGCGIVPANALARQFRDEHGWMNQTIANAATEVWMSVSGQPLRIKPGRDADALL